MRSEDPAPPPPKEHSPQFSAHMCCGQMAGWIKMPIGMSLGFGPGDFVLDGDPVPSPEGAEPSPIFGPHLLWPNGWMDQDGTWHGDGPRPRPHCARWGPSSPSLEKGGAPSPQFSSHVHCGQMAACTRIPLRMEVGLILGDIVLDGNHQQLPSLKGHSSPNFRPMSVLAKLLDGSRCHLARR